MPSEASDFSPLPMRFSLFDLPPVRQDRGVPAGRPCELS